MVLLIKIWICIFHKIFIETIQVLFFFFFLSQFFLVCLNFFGILLNWWWKNGGIFQILHKSYKKGQPEEILTIVASSVPSFFVSLINALVVSQTNFGGIDNAAIMVIKLLIIAHAGQFNAFAEQLAWLHHLKCHCQALNLPSQYFLSKVTEDENVLHSFDSVLFRLEAKQNWLFI